MTRHPPHILVTTPESLFILLTAAKPREMLRSVRTLIVDEIHAVADDKRGSHLALTLARLDRLVEQSGGPKPQRIGLSATVRPIEEVAAFPERPARSVVDVGHRREMDLAVEVPRDELGPVASNEMWDEIYDRMAELIRREPHHAGVRQYAPAVRARGAPSGRAAGRERRAAASRQPVARAAPGRRAAAEGRRTARGGGHGIARIGNRYRHGGPGVPDRLAALHRRRAAARSAAPATGWARCPRAASSPPRATS